jgi:hypothetical protein
MRCGGMKMVIFSLKAVTMMMVTSDLEIQASVRECFAVVANLDTRVRLTRARETGMLSAKNSKKRESRISGTRQGVTTTSSDFKRDFKRWLNPT